MPFRSASTNFDMDAVRVQIATSSFMHCTITIILFYIMNGRPILSGMQATSWLSGIMVALVCLLICHNPRDNIESELLKTGMMTETDLEIMKLKGFNGKAEKSKLIGEDLEARKKISHHEEAHKQHRFRRRPNNRISPLTVPFEGPFKT